MKREGLHGLIQYLNKTTIENTNTQVARTILNNRNIIPEISIEKLAHDNYLSQASVSRFIKQQGYRNIQEYRHDFISTQSLIKINASNYKRNVDQKDNQTIKNQVKKEILNAVNDLDNIDLDQLESLINIISTFSTVVFIGSEFSLSNMYLIQLSMLNNGINAYCYSDPIMMVENLCNITDDCLIICISCSGMWYQSQASSQLRNIIFKQNFTNILFTSIDHHLDEEKFSYVYKYGKQYDGDISCYIQLTYFTPIFRDMYIRHFQ